MDLPPARLVGPVLLALLGLPVSGTAQDDGGFLFGGPGVAVGLHGGYAAPRAGSEIFDFTRERLTVEEDDFHSAALGGWLGVGLTDRLEVVADVSRTGAETGSEFREWVDQDGLPIEQTTSFGRTSATLSLKVYPWSRGRSIGRYVWIPRTVSPWIGAGGGFLWYGFEQEGDFVDFRTLEIFRDRFVSEGQTPTGHLLGGVDVNLNPRFFATGQVRYGWADAAMEDDFVGFDEIDLSGFQATVGLAIRLWGG